MDIHKNARLTPHGRAELAIASAGREVMRLAVGVLNTRDATLAKQLMAEKDRLRQFKQTAVERHFERHFERLKGARLPRSTPATSIWTSCAT